MAKKGILITGGTGLVGAYADRHVAGAGRTAGYLRCGAQRTVAERRGRGHQAKLR